MCATLLVSTLTALVVAPPVEGAGRGGILRGMFATDVDSIDPTLAYYAHSWQVMGAVGANLVRFADAEGSAGSRLVPEVAQRLPRISRDGRTYTFTVRPGFRFSTGKPVTAASFAWAIRRALSPMMVSAGTHFVEDIAGAEAFASGRAATVSGVRVRGRVLTVRLARPVPDFLSRLALPFFMAMDPELHPIAPQGVAAPVHGAGPYFVASYTPNVRLTLHRNRFYGGRRPANVDGFDFEANVGLAAQVLRIRAGEADFAAEGLGPIPHFDLAREYGINRGRYFVRTLLSTTYLALNTQRGITRDAGIRRAVNWAIDRQAIAAQGGYLANRRTDQILPPGMPGWRDVHVYPLRFTERNVLVARRLARGKRGRMLLLAGARGAAITIPQIVRFNLGKLGIEVDVQHLSAGPLAAKAGNASEDFQAVLIGWNADYPDPANFVDVLLNGRRIRASGNDNLSYFDVGEVNRRIEAAAALSGAARYAAFAELDELITTRWAPWASLSHGNARLFVSARVGCFSHHPTFGMNLAVVCRR